MKERRKNTEVHAAINVYRELHGEGYFEGLSAFVVTVLNLPPPPPLLPLANVATLHFPKDL